MDEAEVLGIPVALVALATLIWKVLADRDEDCPAQTREDLSKWLRRADPEAWADVMSCSLRDLFDTVFGKRLIAWKFVRNSFIASIASVAVVTLMWYAIRPAEFLAFVTEGSMLTSIVALLFGSIIFNLIPDLISLIQTRWVLGQVRRSSSRSLRVLIGWLAADLVLTTVVAVGAFAVIYSWLRTPDLREIVRTLTESVLPMHASDWKAASFGIWFYSTYFTSVWVWLYGASTLLVKVGALGKLTLHVAMKLVDVSKKPFRCIAVLSIAIITMAFLPLTLFLRS